MVDKLQKILLISLISLTLLGLVSAADWEFDALDEPYNQYDLSVNTSTVFLTYLETNEGDQISPEDIQGYEEGLYDTESPPYVVFEYEARNSSSGSVFTVNESLSYHDRLGVWYAEFKPNNTDMTDLTFKAKGELNESGGIDSSGEAVATETVTVSDVNTTLLRDNLELDFSQAVKADREEKFDVRTLDITDDQPIAESEAEVDVYFHDLNEVDSSYNLDNYNDNAVDEGGQYHFNAEVSTPEATDRSYVLRINSTTSDGVESSESFFIDTAPAIQGQISDLSSEGCNSNVQECEPGAEIDAEFDVTAASAEGVNMTVYGTNKSSGELENISTAQMNQVEASTDVEQTFEGVMELPDINTSDYEKGLELAFHAWNNERSYIESHEIDLRSFKVQDRSNPTAFKGRSHQVRLLFGKYFSLNPYDHDRFDSVNVSITGGENFTESFSEDDFEYREADGVMVTDVVVPEDEASGTYDLDVSATNSYNETKEFSSGLKVRDVNATFAAESDLEFEYSELSVFTENITLENLVDTDKAVEITTDLGVIDIAEEITLEPGEERELEFDINLSEAESYDGEITFSDSEASYNETAEISIEGPQCSITDGDLCVSEDSLNLDTDQASPVTESVEVTNLGSDSLELETGVTGNISSYISIDQNMTVEGVETLEVLFEPEAPGSYEGSLEIAGNDSEASVDLSSDAEFAPSEPSLTVSPLTIEVGTVAEGEAYSEEVTVENTGEVTVEDIEPVSDIYNFSVDSFTLEPGESNTVELELQSPESSTISFTGDAAGDEITADVSVQADVIEDYSERTDELRDRVSELRSQASSAEIDTDLTEVSAMVDQVNAQWDSGDYEQARTTFQDAQTELDSIESDINSQNSNQDPNGEDPNGSDTEDGGFPILPLIMIFFVLAVIGGFVFYESYIPEEGDPLYGVLGE